MISQIFKTEEIKNEIDKLEIIKAKSASKGNQIIFFDSLEKQRNLKQTWLD